MFNKIIEIKKKAFPGGPVVKTPHFHCGRHGFNPGSGNQDPACLMVWPKHKRLASSEMNNNNRTGHYI